MIIRKGDCFVYKLMMGDDIVYVGQTINFISRINRHQTDKGKFFDRVHIMECDENNINEVEFALICKYSPILNTSVPSIPYSVRETAAATYNGCVSNDSAFNIEKPDYNATLNGRVYGLWAKKGEEREFKEQMARVDLLINDKLNKMIEGMK